MSLEKTRIAVLPLAINKVDNYRFINHVHQDQTHKHAHVPDVDAEEHVYKLLINAKEKWEIIFSLYLIIKSAITIPIQ